MGAFRAFLVFVVYLIVLLTLPLGAILSRGPYYRYPRDSQWDYILLSCLHWNPIFKEVIKENGKWSDFKCPRFVRSLWGERKNRSKLFYSLFRHFSIYVLGLDHWMAKGVVGVEPSSIRWFVFVRGYSGDLWYSLLHSIQKAGKESEAKKEHWETSAEVPWRQRFWRLRNHCQGGRGLKSMQRSWNVVGMDLPLLWLFTSVTWSTHCSKNVSNFWSLESC